MARCYASGESANPLIRSRGAGLRHFIPRNESNGVSGKKQQQEKKFRMKVIKRLVRAASIAGMAMFITAASASAATITYGTNAAGTGFSGGSSLVLDNSAGADATLTFFPNANISSGVPSNVNFGLFTLACPSCTTEAGASFSPFTFDLVITDVTHGGATGTFVGTSTGGAVFSNASLLTINWAPLQLGPGVNNATSGNFGTAIFSTTVFTGIVAPNSGSDLGQTTVQGFVDFTAIPEPATLSLVGGALLGLGILRRKGRSRQ